jgi:hypothetical protein
MENKLISEGRCIYCNQIFGQKEIGKHLAKHLAEKEKGNMDNPTQLYCHIEVQADVMFLHLLVQASAKMKVIDSFLKDIWLECCGHLSAFGHKDFKIKMSDTVEDVFTPRIKIHHDYDFGTTTRVFLKGLKYYHLDEGKKILLLSRNEPLKILCDACKLKPAVEICSVCVYNYDDSYFCTECSEIHAVKCEDFEDYARMPVVNSPRMGECGYTGGAIDVERDGPYALK